MLAQSSFGTTGCPKFELSGIFKCKIKSQNDADKSKRPRAWKLHPVAGRVFKEYPLFSVNVMDIWIKSVSIRSIVLSMVFCWWSMDDRRWYAGIRWSSPLWTQVIALFYVAISVCCNDTCQLRHFRCLARAGNTLRSCDSTRKYWQLFSRLTDATVCLERQMFILAWLDFATNRKWIARV